MHVYMHHYTTWYNFNCLKSNKRCHKIRGEICGEKAALEAAIEAFNLESTYHLPSTDELLMVDNYRWPWECPDTSKYI